MGRGRNSSRRDRPNLRASSVLYSSLLEELSNLAEEGADGVLPDGRSPREHESRNQVDGTVVFEGRCDIAEAFKGEEEGWCREHKPQKEFSTGEDLCDDIPIQLEKNESLKEKGLRFRIFAHSIEFSKKLIIRRVTSALIVFNFLLSLTFFTLISVTENGDRSSHRSLLAGAPGLLIGANVMIFLSGVRVPVLLCYFNSRAILRRNGCLVVVILDGLVWLASLGMLLYLTICIRAEALSPISSSIWIAAQAFMNALRLNTNALTNIALESISLERHVDKKSRKVLGVSIVRITDSINQADIPECQRQVLIDGLYAADTDGNGVLDQVEFLVWLSLVHPRIYNWKDIKCRNWVELKSLLRRLDFKALMIEEDSRVLSLEDDGDDDSKSVFSTAKVGFKQMWCSQKLLVLATLFILFVYSFLQPVFGLLVGMQVNLAAELAADEDPEGRSEFKKGLVGMFLTFFAHQSLYYLAASLGARVVSNTTARIQEDLAKCVLHSDAEFDGRYRTGTLANAFNAGTTRAEEVWDYILFDLVLPISSLISATIFLATVDFGYSIFVLSALPFITSFRMLEHKATSSSATCDASSARLLSKFQNVIGIRNAARVYNSQDFVMDHYHEQLDVARKDNMKCWLWSNVVAAFYSTIGYLLNFVTTTIFLINLSNGRITVGEFFSLTSYITGIIEPIESLGQFSGAVAKYSGAVHKIQSILDDGDTGDEDGGTISDECASIPAISLNQELRLDNIEFAYVPDSPQVLKGVSVIIPAGSYVCLLGPSGCGKSTLLSLLMGMYHPTSGSIQMDGVDVSSLPLRHLQHSIAVVFQETLVFDGTIRDNIAFGYQAGLTGQQRVPLEQIRQAAMDAGIHDFIKNLPDKYNTIIGKESKISVSGGQLQRICGLARALACKPKLLLLDEATSALDKVMEQQVIKTIQSLRDKGMTIISVTHNPATSANADNIIVLEGGCIAESGTYDQLFADKSSLFCKLVEASIVTKVEDDEDRKKANVGARQNIKSDDEILISDSDDSF